MGDLIYRSVHMTNAENIAERAGVALACEDRQSTMADRDARHNTAGSRPFPATGC